MAQNNLQGLICHKTQPTNQTRTVAIHSWNSVQVQKVGWLGFIGYLMPNPLNTYALNIDEL